MNKRLMAFTLLGVLVVAGLVAGLFAGEIQRALTAGRPVVPVVANASAATPQSPMGASTATPATNGATPATVLAQDTFQRKNQTLWGIASDGRQWKGDANVKRVFSIAGGTGQIADGQGTFEALLGQPDANAEVVVGGMLNQFTGGLNGSNLGVVLRWQNANNWYKVLIDGTHLTLLRRLNGATTTIESVSFHAQGGTAYMLRFRAIGAMLFAKAWQAGTAEPTNWVITANDTAFTSGQAGIRVVLRAGVVANITSFTLTTAEMLNTAAI